MSYTYAGSLFATAAAAATASAFDYFTACGSSTQRDVEHVLARPAKILYAELVAESADWPIGSDEEGYSAEDVDFAKLEELLCKRLCAGFEPVCYNCNKRIATRASGTFCEQCCENTHAWDPTDANLIDRLGDDEVERWAQSAIAAGDEDTARALADYTGRCSVCFALESERECEDCGMRETTCTCEAAIVTSEDGTARLCDDCAAARSRAEDAARELDDVLPAYGAKGPTAKRCAHQVSVYDDWCTVIITVAEALVLAAKLEARYESSDDGITSDEFWAMVPGRAS